MIFPLLSDDASIKEYYSKLKTRTIKVLDNITKGGLDSEIEKIDEYMFLMFSPQGYEGSTGLEVRHIKSFEDSCILINQFIPKDPKKMNVLEYYQTLEFIKRQVKNRKKNAKSNTNK